MVTFLWAREGERETKTRPYFNDKYLLKKKKKNGPRDPSVFFVKYKKQYIITVNEMKKSTSHMGVFTWAVGWIAAPPTT